MKQAIFLILSISLCTAGFADDDAQNFKWDLGGIHGTAAQVARQINGGLEDAWSHYADTTTAAKAKQDDLDKQTAADIRSAHDNPAYKTKLAEQTKAEADLKIARDQSNTASAIQLGSIVNQDKAALAKMERAAISDDHQLAQTQAELAEYLKKKADAKAALNKTAEWRSRIVHGIRYGNCIMLPIPAELEFCINSTRVADSDEQTLTVEMDAKEEIPGTEKKNARGDGIDVVDYKLHPIHIVIPRPEKCDATRGSHVNLKMPYRLNGEFAYPHNIPTIHAEPDNDGKLAVLLTAINHVKGPDQAFMNQIDDRVDQQEAKALQQIDKGK
jgi:hypothetical protein